jgi:ATP-dependent protease ClpP protease subunit
MLALVFACASVPVCLVVSEDPRSPYRFENTVDLHGLLEPATLTMAEVEILAKWDAGARYVTLRIDSPGGFIDATNYWMKRLEDQKKLRNVTVVCIVDGEASSMAAVVLESPLCDTRLATWRSSIMFHNARFLEVKGVADANRLRDLANGLDVSSEATGRIVAARMGLPFRVFWAKVKAADWELSVAEALRWRALDAAVSPTEIAPPTP